MIIFVDRHTAQWIIYCLEMGYMFSNFSVYLYLLWTYCYLVPQMWRYEFKFLSFIGDIVCFVVNLDSILSFSKANMPVDSRKKNFVFENCF